MLYILHSTYVGRYATVRYGTALYVHTIQTVYTIHTKHTYKLYASYASPLISSPAPHLPTRLTRSSLTRHPSSVPSRRQRAVLADVSIGRGPVPYRTVPEGISHHHRCHSESPVPRPCRTSAVGLGARIWMVKRDAILSRAVEQDQDPEYPIDSPRDLSITCIARDLGSRFEAHVNKQQVSYASSGDRLAGMGFPCYHAFTVQCIHSLLAWVYIYRSQTRVPPCLPDRDGILRSHRTELCNIPT